MSNIQLVLDCGSTGTRLKQLEGPLSHAKVVDIVKSYDKIQDIIGTPDDNKSLASVLTFASTVHHDMIMANLSGIITVYIGLTAGVRNEIHGHPVSHKHLLISLKRLKKCFANVSDDTLRIHLVYPKQGYTTAEKESEYEHVAVQYALRHCHSDILKRLNKNYANYHIGHIGIGGASIQISCAQSNILRHVLIPYSFTMPQAYSNIRILLNTYSVIRMPRGIYFAIESCYWLVREMYEVMNRSQVEFINREIKVSLLEKDLCTYIQLCKKKQCDVRNRCSANILRLLLRHVFTSDSYIVIMGQNYCGGKVTWPLGCLMKSVNKIKVNKASIHIVHIQEYPRLDSKAVTLNRRHSLGGVDSIPSFIATDVPYAIRKLKQLLCMRTTIIEKGNVPSKKQFDQQLSQVLSICEDEQVRAFCNRRLQCLEADFCKHVRTHSSKEESELIEHGYDVYNVLKVDNHIHAAGSITSRMLCNYMNTHPCEMVKNMRKPITISAMNTHLREDMYEHFDNFNASYSPFGNRQLRHVYLKTHGSPHFANLLKDVNTRLEKDNVIAEMRISIYGRKCDEWSRLAEWMDLHQLIDLSNIRWVIQTPRLYRIWKKRIKDLTFAEHIDYIFNPAIKALSSNKNTALKRLAMRIVGFDSVDDENQQDSLFETNTLIDDPCYSTYLWHMRQQMNRFKLAQNKAITKTPTHVCTLRPHCGESGPIHHLYTAFLLADSINHGIQLIHCPVMMYAFYLTQIGISVSPLSNDSLVCRMKKHPLKHLFSVGLNVTLSTDDPLQFHMTEQPLLEEYSVARRVFRLTNVDVAELMTNSVKQHVETKFDTKTSLWIPDVRKHFRVSQLDREFNLMDTKKLSRKAQSTKASSTRKYTSTTERLLTH